jgi:hypothetical protein
VTRLTDLLQVDGASGNDKLQAGILNLRGEVLGERSAVESVHCQNHSHHLLSVAVIMKLGDTLINNMYAANGFMAKACWAPRLIALN